MNKKEEKKIQWNKYFLYDKLFARMDPLAMD